MEVEIAILQTSQQRMDAHLRCRIVACRSIINPLPHGAEGLACHVE